MKLVTGFWILITGAGFYALFTYANTPGKAGKPSTAWPADSQMVRDAGRANLVLAMHPHCPCSRATMDALAQVMTRCQGLVTAHVLFYKPVSFARGWEQTDLWHSACDIPGVVVLCDEDGQEGERFGAETSGQVMLYAADSALLFKGGITRARGHQGDNPGMETLINCLTHGIPDHTAWPVFGCPLRNSEGAPQ